MATFRSILKETLDWDAMLLIGNSFKVATSYPDIWERLVFSFDPAKQTIQRVSKGFVIKRKAHPDEVAAFLSRILARQYTDDDVPF